MPSTRDIRRRIKSVKNTAQITKAMQMVAASKMRRAQEAALSGRHYAIGMMRMMESLRHNAGTINHPLWNPSHRPGAKPCVLIVSTDKGLCGALNTNLFREASTLPADTVYVSVGRRAKQFLARTKRQLLADFEISEKASFVECRQVSKFLIDQFRAGEIDSVSVLYNQFVNTLVQKPRLQPLFPLTSFSMEGFSDKLRASVEEAIDTGAAAEYLFEPSAESVLEELLPAFIHFVVFQMILEARASEHSARMVAMKSATDNAKSLIKDLTLEYNKARQASITNEILEIASAQLAME